MTPREKKIAKIKAMLAMTLENGASEAEAMFALARARKMMDEEGITDADLAFNGESVTEEARVKTDHDNIRNYLATAVGLFCGCQSWRRGTSDLIIFCGLQSEAIFAHWLLDMLGDFVVRELDNFADKSVRRLYRAERTSFIDGCTGRINQRLRELAPAPATSTGRDLVVAKNALVEAYMKERGIRLREPFKLRDPGDDSSFWAGVNAGDQAQFNRPVDGRDERKLLQ